LGAEASEGLDPAADDGLIRPIRRRSGDLPLSSLTAQPQVPLLILQFDDRQIRGAQLAEQRSFEERLPRICKQRSQRLLLDAPLERLLIMAHNHELPRMAGTKRAEAEADRAATQP
jgi:hypothetical protein